MTINAGANRLFGCIVLSLLFFTGFTTRPQRFEPQGPIASDWIFSVKQDQVAQSDITARNICFKRHRFQVELQNLPFMKLLGPATFQVNAGSEYKDPVRIDATGLKPGDYEGTAVVICETCPKEKGCTQDRQNLHVRMTVVSAKGEVAPQVAARQPAPPTAISSQQVGPCEEKVFTEMNGKYEVIVFAADEAAAKAMVKKEFPNYKLLCDTLAGDLGLTGKRKCGGTCENKTWFFETDLPQEETCRVGAEPKPGEKITCVPYGKGKDKKWSEHPSWNCAVAALECRCGCFPMTPFTPVPPTATKAPKEGDPCPEKEFSDLTAKGTEYHVLVCASNVDEAKAKAEAAAKAEKEFPNYNGACQTLAENVGQKCTGKCNNKEKPACRVAAIPKKDFKCELHAKENELRKEDRRCSDKEPYSFNCSATVLQCRCGCNPEVPFTPRPN
jgi:hypothetical protein